MDIWLTSIVSLLAAFIGGWIAEKYALRAQKQAAEDQRQRDQETEQRTVKGTLQAIATELRVLKRENFDELQETLNERQNLTPLAMTRTEQNYFIVIESNAGALGRINDEKLREDIIRVYGHAKGLMDSLNAHFRDAEHWREISGTGPDRQTLPNRLARLETGIRNGLDETSAGAWRIASEDRKISQSVFSPLRPRNPPNPNALGRTTAQAF